MRAGPFHAIGADFGGGRIVLAKAVRGRAARVVFRGEAGSREAAAALEEVRRDVAAGRAFCAIAAPAGQTVFRRLAAPFASRRKMEKVWKSLLDVSLPFPVEDAACAHAESRPEGGRAVVAAAAIREADLAAELERAEKAGLEATQADVAALALWSEQVLLKPPAREDAESFLVWVGLDCSLCLRGRGTELLAAHAIRHPGAGEKEREELLRKRLPLLLAEGPETASAWWAGPGAEGAGAAERLAGLLPAGSARRQAVHAKPGELLARALARRALEGSGENLRDGEALHPALRRRAERAEKRLAWGAIAAAAALVALNAAWGTALDRRGRALKEEVHRVAAGIVGPGLQTGQERLMAERAVEKRDAAMAPVRRSMAPDGAETALAELLEAAQGKGLEFSRLRLSSAGFSLEGTTTGPEGTGPLREALEAAGWRIQDEEHPGPDAAGRARFLLKGAAVRHGA
jgi:hypothetical protein